MLRPESGVVLDCSSPEATARSLSALLNIPRASLDEKCRGFDLHRFYEHDWGPARELPGRVLGIALTNRSYPVHFFHATRVLPTETLFASGILPLAEAVEVIWDSLWPLSRDFISAAEWQTFRRSVETDHPSQYASLYRLKISDARIHGGPFGFLIRAIPIFKAAKGGPWHDYLATPEIVEDICTAFRHSFGADLIQAYEAASRPCIVKFEALGDAFDLATALLYLCHSIHGFDPNIDLGACHDAGGRQIPVDRVRAIEVEPE